jgi:hypothetical protein
MTLGITVFGIIQRNLFSDDLKKIFEGMGDGQEQMADNPAFNDPRVLLAPEARAQIPESDLDKITDVLSSSIAHTFMWALIPTALAIVAAVMMSKERLDSSVESQQAAKLEPSLES